MFGRKKMYKKGMEDAMRAYEQFGKKQEAVLEKIREEVRNGNKKLEDMISELGEDINNVYEFLTDKEKAALYNLCTPKDIKDLGDSERRMLLAILYQLAENEGAWGLTDYQKKYIRSVQRYLEITNPQTSIELSVVENIDSVDDQKAILQSVLEFLYLQDTNELSDDQEDFLEYFCINKKQAQQIELYVSKLYNTVGPEGLCEKYGFVPEDGKVELTSNDGSSDKKYTIYYDLNTKAIRRWEDDMVLVEPRYNASFEDTHQIGNKLLWKNVENSHTITHVVDIPSGKELLKMQERLYVSWNELVTIYGISDKNYCLWNEGILSVIDYDGGKERMTIPTVMKEKLELCTIGFSYNRFIVGWYMYTENSLDEDFEYGHCLIAYDTITGKNFEVDCFKLDEGDIEDIYISNNLLFVILKLPKNRAKDDTYYDIWCYDLEKKTYKWKQYKHFSTKYNGWRVGGKFSITDRDGKLFYYHEVTRGQSAYLVIEMETGELLKKHEFYERHGAYWQTTIIGNTFLSICCGWADGRDFYCYYQAVDANTLSDDTDEIKEIVKKVHL